MRIIQFLAALTILLTPALANAQAKPYIEGQIGLLTNMSDLFETEIDSDAMLGIEVGAGEIQGTGFRVGLSYSQTGVEIGEGSEDDFSLISLNVYHDFDSGTSLVPYLGLGIGSGEFDEASTDGTMGSLYAGANYDINENFYIGGRTSFHMMEFENGAGRSDDLTIWTFGIVGGVKF